MNKIQHFNIEMSIFDKRNIRGFELENKIKVIFISDPNINISSCSIAVGAGYLQDVYPGTAHFLEHLLFMGSEKYPEQNDYHSYIQINGGQDNAFTADNMTCYYLVLETSFLKKGIEMLSWFFRAPLLNEEHIKSEMEIIDSEHNKNILDDEWIMDDIFKNFIEDGSKYKKFGTGSLKSLNKITKEDISDFYDKYYTTDNLYICVVDSKSMEQMIDEYLIFFNEIPSKFYTNQDRFQKDNLKLINNDLIIFNSSSDYFIINYYLILEATETNLTEYQLVHFINYLIGTEYYDSLGYYLKEKNIVKSISSSIDYFYDFTANINIRLIMVDDDSNKIVESYFIISKLLEQIKNLSETEFIDIYNNYRKIKTLKLLYDSTNDPVFISNNVAENMIKGNLSEAILRNNKVPEYDYTIFKKYIEIVNSIILKITTNINLKNISENDFTMSKWYSTSYYVDNITFKKDKIFKSLNEIIFNFENIIGIKNFVVKTNFPNFKYNKSDIPELIYKSDKLQRKVFLLEANKYDKPISSVSIIRINELLLDKYNKVLISIYEEICYKTLNYYLETISDYKLTFSMSVYKDSLIYNFIGINYQLDYFITEIAKKIYPDIILYNNTKSEKYFIEIIRDMKENIKNFKFNSPYVICSKYLSYLLDDNLLPEEKYNFINNLTWKDFVPKITECLKYKYEYYLLVGIKKYGHEINIFYDYEYQYNKDQYINYFIDTLQINPNKYLNQPTMKFKSKTNNPDNPDNPDNKLINKKTVFKNYSISSFDKNPNEINNCLVRYWLCGERINLIIDDSHKINIEITIKIIKLKLIMSFVSEILNEPLFDKIRTIDKLGYIVKVDNKIISPFDNSLYFIIIFIIQSSYSIDRVSESIINFNKFIIKDLKTNYDGYLEKFRLLKESKLIDFKKFFSDLSEELSSYVMSIVSKNFIFNINTLYQDICSKITFSEDVEPIIYTIINKNSKYFDIILKKN
jgi:insulysin